MRKRILFVILSVILALALTACTSSSTTTTTVTTTVTDSEGNTTTKTETTETGIGEDGVPTTVTTVTESTSGAEEAASEGTGFTAEELSAAWHERFTGGAKGTSEAGDEIYFVYNIPADDADMNYAAIMIVSDGGEHLSSREGEVYAEEDHLVLSDPDMDSVTPFSLEDGEGDDFTMTFLGDGDVAVMTAMDLDSIIDEMVSVYMSFVQG